MRCAAKKSLPTLILAIAALTALAITIAHAGPDRDRARDMRERFVIAEPLDREAPLLVSGSGNPAKARADTVYLLGGPDRWDGRFETPDGQPDWHGWTTWDGTLQTGEYWSVTDEPELVINGDWSLWCGVEYPEPGPLPVPGFGYGNNWDQSVVFTHTVADPGASSDVIWSLILQHDTEPWYDFVYLQWNSGGQWNTLASFDGVSPGVLDLEYAFTVPAGQYVGPDGNQIQLRISFVSDSSYSDQDGLHVTERGACQVDDIAVVVDGELVSFTDFEDGQMGDWLPVLPSGVGDFAMLRANLPDLDPCQTNSSWQVSFIDDGVVVPGTGGTPCISWCYGPGGWIVNNTGGLIPDDPINGHLWNLVVSPPLAWPEGMEAGQLDFDVYVHEEIGSFSVWPGMFYMPRVRSTASEDPAALEFAPWEFDFFQHGGPEYRRHQLRFTDLLVDDPRWIQVSLQVVHGRRFHTIPWHGNDGTPAPYFDNVAVRAWVQDGPEISVRPDHFQDAFPEQGFVDPDDPASNWCRIDNARRQSNGVPYDAIQFSVIPQRRHAQLDAAPRLHWVMRCNPLFDEVRPEAPGPDGILRGMVTAELIYSHPQLARWWVDLPDTGFFYPGDILRYYITATEVVPGNPDYHGFSVWPADTTAVTDFSLGSPYPRLAEIRALPTLDSDWQQPAILLWESTTGEQSRPRWLQALTELGLVPGVDVDIYTNRRPTWDVGQGPGGRCTIEQLDRYETLIIAADGLGGPTIGSWGVDLDLLTAWLDRGGKKVLAVGDNLVATNPASPFLARHGVGQLNSTDLFALSGPPRDLQIVAQPGNAVLPPDGLWPLAVGCPDPARIDVLSTTGDALTAANLAGPDGQDLGYPAVIARVEDALANRFLMLPVPLMQVAADAGGEDGGKRLSATPPERLELLSHLLAWLGVIEGGPTSVPAVHSLQIAAYPNPFNPRTVFAYELPQSDRVQLAVYDLRGKLVRRLVDERQDRGRHEAEWDGRDAAGRAVASGVYFYRFTAGQDQRGGKLTLLK